MKKYFNAILGILLIPIRVKIFNPKKIFNGKRVAIVGPADSAYEKENRHIIDEFDFVIRINKALVTWNSQNEIFIGTKTDILFHNFHENLDNGGGGPLNTSLFSNFGVKYLIQPRFDYDGWRSIFNYFKKYINAKYNIYILPYYYYRDITNMFAQYHPTKGFCALYSAITSQCSELLITGFTFFKTPYSIGYRDNMRDMNANINHILNQGLHDINMEYKNFILLIEKTSISNIFVDDKLFDILKEDRPDLMKNIQKIK